MRSSRLLRNCRERTNDRKSERTNEQIAGQISARELIGLRGAPLFEIDKHVAEESFSIFTRRSIDGREYYARDTRDPIRVARVEGLRLEAFLTRLFSVG